MTFEEKVTIIELIAGTLDGSRVHRPVKLVHLVVDGASRWDASVSGKYKHGSTPEEAVEELLKEWETSLCEESTAAAERHAALQELQRALQKLQRTSGGAL